MPVLDLSTIAEDFNENPYPHYARLREIAPIHRVKAVDGQEVWLVVGHDEARQALTHPDVSKNWLTSGLYTDREKTDASANMMRADPPHHTRLRRLVSRSFAPGRIETLRPRIQQIVDGLLDDMAALPERRADLIDAFARPLPMTVICELLGIPEDARGPFHDWVTEIVSPTGVEAENTALRAMTAYLAELTDAKLAAPGDDLLSDWTTSRGEDGDRLSRQELVAMAFLMMIGGHETTVHLISNAMRALFAHPDQLAALRADLDGLTDGAVEEALRYDGPVETATFRFARADLEIGGALIEAGSPVLVSSPEPTGTPTASRVPTPSTSAAPDAAATSPSATASTTASAPPGPTGGPHRDPLDPGALPRPGRGADRARVGARHPGPRHPEPPGALVVGRAPAMPRGSQVRQLLQPHPAPLPPGQLTGLRDPERGERLAPVTRIGALAAHQSHEGRQLRLVRGGEPFQEARPRLARRGRAVRLRRGDRRTVVQPRGDLVPLPGELHPHVVPGAVATGAGTADQRPVVQGEDGHRRVDVTGFPEHGRPRVRPGRVHLRHLVPGDPADHVEVVHQAVPVQPPEPAR